MRITITCEGCGRRHELARNRIEPGLIWLVCHGCETPLQAQLGDATSVADAVNGDADAPAHGSFASAWDGVIDMGIGKA